MDYEKKYKEALERAKLSRRLLLDIGEEVTEIEYIFPELVESNDEKIKKELINFFSDLPDSDTFRGIPPSKVITWLEKQDKQEWSEEDERLRNSCIAHIEDELERVRNDKYGHSEIISDLKESCRERINWLKSLRPQSGWKPSNEQIDILGYGFNG